MIMNLKKFLGLQTSKEKLQEYKMLKSRLKEIVQEGNVLSDRFMIQKSIMDDIQSLPTDLQNTVYSKYAEFSKSHAVNVSSIVNERNTILKTLEKIRLDSELTEICRDIDTIELVTDNYNQNKITKSVYYDIIKGINGEPIKYADTIVMNKHGQILVLHRSNDYMSTGKVCIPGGHVDQGEDFMSAAIRELKEETNLDPIGSVRKVGEHKTPDAEIEYFIVHVDEQQPVTVQAEECCFCEWVDIYTIPALPFIFDQGKNVFNILAEDCPMINKAKDAFDKGMITSEVLKKISKNGFKLKSMGVENAAPVIPESLSGSKKKVTFVGRDPDMNLKKIFKSLSGVTDGIKIGGQEIKTDKPLTIHDVLYKSSSDSKYLVDIEVVYSGEIKIMAEILAKLGGFSLNDISISTPHENFMLVNSYGTDYIGDPVFADL